ncbi:hypothetical protein LTR37_013924 [Vermiconidia calcicola]|uniref:Uncharacterized protein n=1 Tax=Vermiconidia calcicola TaxID=1690605 RepID=A0ACC3MW15_9PEZI|nr:hypothetical protein LTR37_013924 [Vermiconidia calcicola]
MHMFLEYAATFLQSVGNYYGHGDQKFTPRISDTVLARLSFASDNTSKLYPKIAKALTSSQPSRLGYPDTCSQSWYYTGSPISADEVAAISKAMLERSIDCENTSIQKHDGQDGYTYDVLQASVESEACSDSFYTAGGHSVRIVRGDHSRELAQICDSLTNAQDAASNPAQRQYLAKLIESFQSGSMERYKEAQRLWIEDLHPSVEAILGFIEPYRDPYGVRAEFEGLVGIMNEEETGLLSTLVKHADHFIATLPWVDTSGNCHGKGPFELPKMDNRDFTSVYALAYCSTLIFPGINLPNYNDIRQQRGSKNIMISNAIDGGSMSSDSEAKYIHPHEQERFMNHRRQTYYLWVVFHELFGHGTGRFLEESEQNVFNFDINNPPINPLTDKPIESWYRPHQTWTGVFGDLATTVDECRAECVGAYLLSNRELREMCGFTGTSAITPSDLEYNLYLQLAVSGLRSLEKYSEDGQKWTQAHSRVSQSTTYFVIRNVNSSRPGTLRDVSNVTRQL